NQILDYISSNSLEMLPLLHFSAILTASSDCRLDTDPMLQFLELLLATLHCQLLCLIQTLALRVPEVLLCFSSLAVGVAQLDFHFIQISLHLLLKPYGIIPAPDLSVQRALHGLYHSQVIPLQLINFLILLSNPPVNVSLHLVELKLDAEDFAFFMFQ
uniref:Uncharacterized protein n=1 Tax=Varanus komodoensis TaxID=61221 RepID=A0A8D2ISZ5_VARKO